MLVIRWAELPNAEKDVYAQQARELEAHVKVMLNEGQSTAFPIYDSSSTHDSPP